MRQFAFHVQLEIFFHQQEPVNRAPFMELNVLIAAQLHASCVLKVFQSSNQIVRISILYVVMVFGITHWSLVMMEIC